MYINANYVEEFKKTITKGDFKQYLELVLNRETSLEVYCAAIYQGYLDACRTFKGEYLKKDDERIKALATQLKNYLDNNSEEFNHNKYCKILMEDNRMSFGQAQKIVNMTFKYLFCLVELSVEMPYYSLELQRKFYSCHMPLDRIMLEWLRRKDENIEKTKIGVWSNMCDSENDLDEFNHYTYSFYQKIVNMICEKEKKTPLQLDFENWKEMKLILAAEEFLWKISDNKISMNCSKHELFEQIKQVIHQYDEKC